VCSNPVVNSGSNPCPQTSTARKPEGHQGEVGTGVFLGGRFSMEDIVAFGGLSPPPLDLRSSERIRRQQNPDATQLERGQQLA
jgi:hypothetical protein